MHQPFKFPNFSFPILILLANFIFQSGCVAVTTYETRPSAVEKAMIRKKCECMVGINCDQPTTKPGCFQHKVLAECIGHYEDNLGNWIFNRGEYKPKAMSGPECKLKGGDEKISEKKKVAAGNK